MFAKFNFRVSAISLLALFAATIAYVLFVRSLATHTELMRLFAWLAEALGPKGAVFAILLNRALETLLFVVLPFRAHIQERPSLVWLTLATSLAAASALNWLLWSLPMGGFVLLAIAHLFAAGIYFLFIWREDTAPQATQSA